MDGDINVERLGNAKRSAINRMSDERTRKRRGLTGDFDRLHQLTSSRANKFFIRASFSPIIFFGHDRQPKSIRADRNAKTAGRAKKMERNRLVGKSIEGKHDSNNQYASHRCAALYSERYCPPI